jgi:hypothetical protein
VLELAHLGRYVVCRKTTEYLPRTIDAYLAVPEPRDDGLPMPSPPPLDELKAQLQLLDVSPGRRRTASPRLGPVSVSPLASFSARTASGRGRAARAAAPGRTPDRRRDVTAR